MWKIGRWSHLCANKKAPNNEVINKPNKSAQPPPRLWTLRCHVRISGIFRQPEWSVDECVYSMVIVQETRSLIYGPPSLSLLSMHDLKIDLIIHEQTYQPRLLTAQCWADAYWLTTDEWRWSRKETENRRWEPTRSDGNRSDVEKEISLHKWTHNCITELWERSAQLPPENLTIHHFSPIYDRALVWVSRGEDLRVVFTRCSLAIHACGHDKSDFVLFLGQQRKTDLFSAHLFFLEYSERTQLHHKVMTNKWKLGSRSALGRVINLNINKRRKKAISRANTAWSLRSFWVHEGLRKQPTFRLREILPPKIFPWLRNEKLSGNFRGKPTCSFLWNSN